MMREFSVLDSPLEGTNLIEASAGTGKTYTISMIYLRLIVEKKLPVDAILVVTFTIPATAELRTRIRQCIKKAADYLEHNREADADIRGIIDRNRESGGLRERLHSALRAFDEASVFTIHSFCQQVLSDNAFESGSPFHAAVTTDDRRPGLAVRDYWRRLSYDLPDHTASVLASSMGPAGLLNIYKKKPMSPDYKLKPDIADAGPGDIESAYASVYKCYNNLCAVWQKERGSVTEILTGSASLSGKKYNKKYVPGYIEKVEKYPGHGDPLMWNDKVEKFTVNAIESGVNKGREAPVSPFFNAAQAMKEHIDVYKDTVRRYRVTVMKQLFESADREISLAAASSGERGFDDLIRGVYTGLRSPMGDKLGEKIRNRYRAALIDEFQDTDSMQFAIFSSMFGRDTALFLIGDPKQAIYRFRGADIFSYMKAADMADSRYTLARNWRSTGGLISAVNHIFSGCRDPFVFDRIQFNPVKPGTEGQGHDLLCRGNPVPPMVFELVDYQTDPDEYTPERDRIIAAGLAAAVNTMLAGDYTINSEGLRPVDIAVLVRSNKQAAIIKSALSSAGVPAVTRSAESVFNSKEAGELYFVLSAILNPSDNRRLRTALSTALCGFTAEQIASMADASLAGGISGQGEDVSARFHSYRDAWNRGFMDMFMLFMEEESVASRIFLYTGGERSMANLMHIAEILGNEAVSMKLTPADTLKRLAAFISDPPEGEEYSMRLETDEEAVNVMTMHSSKGLEFPVVFCPYLAASPASSRKDDVTVYHDNDDEGSRPVLYLDRELPEDVKERKRQEDESETARLIYVALTRARSHCNVMIRVTPKFGETLLSKILFTSRGSLAESIEGKIDGGNAGRLLALISEESGGTIGFVQGRPLGSEIKYVKSAPSAGELRCREFTGDLSQRWRMYSYSAIALSIHDAELKEDEGGVTAYSAEPGVLPPGARSGLCLHEIFENSDFTWSEKKMFSEAAAAVLRKYGYAREYDENAACMVVNVLSTPLDSKGLRLSMIPGTQRLSELEFHFPVESLAGLRRFITGPDFAGLAQGVNSENIPSLEGMMKGYIDLVFFYDRRYYIIDWKSNMLELSQGDYSRESILAEMKKHNYHLQYHIYTVALHRYLSLRLGKDYDYNKHFGGVYYLFIRGMNGADNSGVSVQGLNCG